MRFLLCPNLDTVARHKRLASANRHFFPFRRIFIHMPNQKPPRLWPFHAHHFASRKRSVIPFRKAAPVEQLRQCFLILRVNGICCRRVKRHINIFPVNSRYTCHIFRIFHTPLNFQRRNACFNQLRQNIHCRDILRGKQITLCNIIIPTIKCVRQTAGLRTASAVTAPSSQNAAHDALAGIADTECAMNKSFDFRICMRCYFLYFLQRKFAAQYNLPKSLPCPVFHISKGICRHLRAGMKRETREMLPHEPRRARILHNQRIYTHLIQTAYKFQKAFQFFFLI